MSDLKGPLQADKIGELFYNKYNGEGDVVLSCELMDLDTSTQLTTIQDWIDALRNLYVDIYRAEFEEKPVKEWI